VSVYVSTEKQQLCSSLEQLHSTLETRYNRLFNGIGAIQETAQRLSREMVALTDEVHKYRQALPEMYEEVQAMIQACEDRARDLDEVEDYDRDSIDTSIEDMRAHIVDMTDALDSIVDALPVTDREPPEGHGMPLTPATREEYAEGRRLYRARRQAQLAQQASDGALAAD